MTVVADELKGNFEINADRLIKIKSFDKYKNISGRQKIFESQLVDIALMVDSAIGVNEFILIDDDKEKKIKVAEDGELIIPEIGEILSDKNVFLMLPKDKYKDGIEIGYRIKIKFPKNQTIDKKTMLTAVNQYESAVKVMFGWAAFAVPVLDCLSMVYSKDYLNKDVAILDENLPSEKIIKTNYKNMIFIDFNKQIETLKILEQPQWIYGCKYSRWKTDWE